RNVQRPLQALDVKPLEGRHRRAAQRLRRPACGRDRMRAAVGAKTRLADRVAVDLDLEPDPDVQDPILGLADSDARAVAGYVTGSGGRVEPPLDLGAVIHKWVSSLAENGAVCRSKRARRVAPGRRGERETPEP